MKVVLVDYDTSWPERYESERERLIGELGALALQIEHIGSTAVPGLAAKPIVDIAIAVADVTSNAMFEALTGAGYDLHVDELNHRMYRTPAADVHVHLWPAAGPDFDRHVRFRDALRSNPSQREKYETEKRRLAELEWPARNDYAEAKGRVIEEILRS